MRSFFSAEKVVDSDGGKKFVTFFKHLNFIRCRILDP